MIDRQSRDLLAEKLRQFVSGQITNFDLEGIEISSDDAGVYAIADASWLLYSDSHEHKATDRNKISGEARESVARWICFLHTDLEYQWPKMNQAGEVLATFFNKITFGLWGRLTHMNKRINTFAEAGDVEYWPFLSVEVG